MAHRLLAAVALLLAAAAYPATHPAVPEGHPRVYVRSADLPALRAKIDHPEFQHSWRLVRGAQSDPRHGYFYSAFVYLVTGDKAAGRRAVEGGLAAVKASSDARTFGMPFHLTAIVYDWCYDLLTAEEKRQFIAEFERIAASHSPGYPAQPRSHGFVGHNMEGWVLTGQLPAGVAIYDESKTMYDAAVALFFNSYVPARNFHYRGHAHHQGDSYFSRFMYDQAASWLFRRMGAGDVLSREQQFVPYQVIYNLRPDGQQMRRGDTFDDSGRSHARKIEDSKRFCVQLAGYYYEDPYLLWLGDSDLFNDLGAFEHVFRLLFRKPGLRTRPISELPLAKYFPEPIGDMTLRTGWTLGPESRDAVIDMRIGQYFFGNHQRKDFGIFQIYYRGALAISSGLYRGYGTDHWKYYYHPTISHNGLLILDPDEGGNVPDGGQRWPNNGRDHPMDLEMLLSRGYQMGEVTAHEIGPDEHAPDYGYLAGDITRAYSNKVRKVTRSMVAINTRNAAAPAAFVVFDRVHASNPAFKKTWLLHTIQEPRLDGRAFTVVRDEPPYSGRLSVNTLLPTEARITKIGGPGKEFWVEPLGRNFPPTTRSRPPQPGEEPGAWRVEVSPAAPAAEDRFLHAMIVGDAGAPQHLPAQLVSSGEATGARVLEWTILFSDTGRPLRQLDLTLPAAGKVLVCDAAPGAWQLHSPGAQPARVTASATGQCLFFRAAAGTHRLQRAAAGDQ